MNPSSFPIDASPLLSDRLADFCVGFSEKDMTPIARQRAFDAFCDVLGCIVAGCNERPVASVRSAVSGSGSGSCHAVGTRATFSATEAALINGTAAHALDYDDNFFPAITHASAVLVPALLAVGEQIDATMDMMLTAYVAGLEIQARLGELANPSHYEAGWHATSTLGTIGVAAAICSLRGSDLCVTRNALSLATSMGGGSKLQFGTSAKPVHAGLAAMHGIMAVDLAAAGVDATANIFEGAWGFLHQHDAPTLEAGRVGETGLLAIERYGLVAKRYPSCMSSHLGIDGILLLREEHGFTADEIETIEIAMPAFMIANLRFLIPETVDQARFSMPYCAAIAAIDGAPRLGHFNETCLRRPDWRHIADRVTMVQRTATESARSLPWGGDALVKITLRGGRVLAREIAHPKGAPGNPMTAIESQDKLRDCLSRGLPEAEADRFLGELSGRSLGARAIGAWLAQCR